MRSTMRRKISMKTCATSTQKWLNNLKSLMSKKTITKMMNKRMILEKVKEKMRRTN
jgi:hypothetical protein